MPRRRRLRAVARRLRRDDGISHKLEHVILPLFYKEPDKFAEVMRSAIEINGSFFNTQRMMFQYIRNAYAPDADSCEPLP
jgi:hypothetical protein